MCRSPWVYKRLRRFSAGVESGITFTELNERESGMNEGLRFRVL
jgi:hypothetical protein